MLIIKTPRMLREEARLGRPLEEIIPETYERLRTLEATSNALGIDPNTLYSWMLRLGITINRQVVVAESRSD